MVELLFRDAVLLVPSPLPSLLALSLTAVNSSFYVDERKFNLASVVSVSLFTVTLWLYQYN